MDEFKMAMNREKEKDNEAESRENELQIFTAYLAERLRWLAYESKYSDRRSRQELRDISFRIDKELLK